MTKVYGPYKRKDGRYHMCIISTNKRTTISYPKYLMQQKLSRKLKYDETVDHIDENLENNEISNFQILSRKENTIKSKRPRKFFEFKCPNCKTKCFKPYNYVKNNWALGKSGPFCSKSCASIFQRFVNKNRIKKVKTHGRMVKWQTHQV